VLSTSRVGEISRLGVGAVEQWWVMTSPDYLSAPDEHLDPAVAATYDASVAGNFAAAVVGPAVGVLAQLAGDGVAVEFAAGTGRIALPLAEAGVEVLGIDFSEPMLAELRAKPGAERIQLTVGDMTATRVCSDAALVYLVFNTITNLRTQQQQVACFRNAAAHLGPGGCFVVETGVPKLASLPPGESVRAFDVSPTHLGFEDYIDRVNQISISHHYFIETDRRGDASGNTAQVVSGAFRYVWPSELDLMAQLAGMTLESRWADWHGTEFTGEAESHVSVWRKF